MMLKHRERHRERQRPLSFLTCVCSVCVCVWWGVAAAQHLVCQAWLGNKVGRALAFPAVEAMHTAARRSDAHQLHWGETIKLTAHKMPELTQHECQTANIKSYLD